MTIWRQGGKIPHHTYLQRGEEPDRRPWPDGDPPIGMFLDPADAMTAVNAVNKLSALKGLILAIADDWDLKGYELDDPKHAAYRECAARLRGYLERTGITRGDG